MAGEGQPKAGAAGLRLHHLRPAPGARKARTRVGRGEASKGKTAGRGTKGTKARGQVPASFEGGQMPLHRRVPQLKGFSNLRFKTTYQVVNTGRLAAAAANSASPILKCHQLATAAPIPPIITTTMRAGRSGITLVRRR